MTRRIIILGSTGSIGTQALDVVRQHPGTFDVVGLAAGRNATLLVEQAREFGVRHLALADTAEAKQIRDALDDCEILDGPEGVRTLAELPADLVLNGITGAAGLASTLAALAAGTPVALANKESLIVGGELVTRAADAIGERTDVLIPVDSEHSAIAQCLRGGRRHEVERIILTASGGPFRGESRAQLAQVTATEALEHPTWDMGPVVTINSATLMNKGLEVIEAHELFGVAYDALDVVVHPQSVVHSMVEFIDGSTLAQLSPPDMRLPIQLAMAWPERLGWAPTRCGWDKAHSLTFEPADRETFRALDVAVSAGRRGGTYPAVMNAANEVAVDAFLRGQLGFLDIAELVAATLDAWDRRNPTAPRDVEEVFMADAWARRDARARVGDDEARVTR